MLFFKGNLCVPIVLKGHLFHYYVYKQILKIDDGNGSIPCAHFIAMNLTLIIDFLENASLNWDTSVPLG